MEAWVVKREFGVGTLEMSSDEGLEEAIEILRIKPEKELKKVLNVADGCLLRPNANMVAITGTEASEGTTTILTVYLSSKACFYLAALVICMTNHLWASGSVLTCKS